MSFNTLKPVAIVLGGTVPHSELVRNLQTRGYHVVLVDYLKNPPAAAVADEHLRESTLDHKVVHGIAKSRKASLVISTCIDQANVTACYVAERLGLHTPYSFETARRVTNKYLMKTGMLESGIRTSRFIKGTKLEDFERIELTYPLIVKPTDSNSSKGVLKVDHPATLKKAIEEALCLSRKGEALVEEYVVGREIGFDAFIKNGKASILLTRERRKILKLEKREQQIYGSFWPASLEAKIEEQLKLVAEKIASEFKLDNTPLMLQSIVQDEKVSVIEFAPRIGGGENYRIIKTAIGADVIDYAIQSFLGEVPNIHCKHSTEIYADNYLYVKPCKFGKIEGFDALIDNGIIEYAETYKKYGQNISAQLSSNNRVGAFVVKAPSETEVLNKLRKALNYIEIFDTKGISVMHKEIYDGSF